MNGLKDEHRTSNKVFCQFISRWSTSVPQYKLTDFIIRWKDGKNPTPETIFSKFHYGSNDSRWSALIIIIFKLLLETSLQIPLLLTSWSAGILKIFWNLIKLFARWSWLTWSGCNRMLSRQNLVAVEYCQSNFCLHYQTPEFFRQKYEKRLFLVPMFWRGNAYHMGSHARAWEPGIYIKLLWG